MYSPIVWKSVFARLLPTLGIEFSDDTRIIAGSANPTVTAQDAQAGSIYISTSTKHIYQKQDTGSSTNWTQIPLSSDTINAILTGFTTTPGSGSINTIVATDSILQALQKAQGSDEYLLNNKVTISPSATDNAIVRFDDTTGKLIQNSLVTIDDTGNISVPALATVDGVDVSAHAAASSGVHGVTGSVVGTTDTQDLTNKNLASSTNSLTGASASSFTNSGTVTLPTGTVTLATTGNLSQFASTTSAQLAGIMSDETGSAGGGVLVFSNSPSITTPSINTNFALGNTTVTTDATTTKAFHFPNTDVASSTGTGALVLGTSPSFTTQIDTPKLTHSTSVTLESTSGNLYLGAGANMYFNTNSVQVSGSIDTASKFTIGNSSFPAKHDVNGGFRLSEDIEVTGIGSSPHTASKMRLAFGSGVGFFSSYGADDSTVGSFAFRQRSSANSIDITTLVSDTTGSWVMGPSTAATTVPSFIVNTGASGATGDYSKISSGQIAFCNSSSTKAYPTVMGRTDDNLGGLIFYALSPDANTAGDMVFQVGLNTTGGAHSTTTRNAYTWYNGASLVLGSCTRGGAWTLGPTPSNGTTSLTHNVQANGTVIQKIASSSGSNNVAVTQYWWNNGTFVGQIGGGTGAQLITGGTNGNLCVIGNSAIEFAGNNGAAVHGLCSSAGAWSNVAGGSWGTISDARLKKNIQPLCNGLSTILALNPVSYEWRDKNVSKLRPTEHFIAGEVELVNPNWVSITGSESILEDGEILIIDDVKQVNLDASFNAYLVKAIQEQHTIIEALKSRIEALENK
jgi:hypothetical protein